MRKKQYNPTLTLKGKQGDILQVSPVSIYLISEVITSLFN